MIKWLEKVEDFFLNILKKIGLGFLAKIYENHREGMRYIVFGVLATIVNIGMYALCAKVIFSDLDEASRVNYSNYIAIGTAIVFAYVCNKLFVFDSKTNGIKELFREFSSFIGCRIVSAVIEIIIMYVTVVKFGLNEIIMKFLTNVIVMIINFIFSKLIIFKNKLETK